MAEVDGQIAELAHRSTDELRFAWRQLHRVEPPQGLSRDLLIRASPIRCKSRVMAEWAGHCGAACRS
jgi:hypothetical protein